CGRMRIEAVDYATLRAPYKTIIEQRAALKPAVSCAILSSIRAGSPSLANHPDRAYTTQTT
ncbi:MAG: hypothetical protein WAN35_14380, partial [Terracidiphilus sp.]